MPTDTTKGIYLGIVAAVSIAVMGVFVKLIGTSQSNFTILFFRFFISLLILLPIILKNKSFSFKIKFPYSLSSRMVFGFLAMALYFYAIQHIELVNAILLESSYPIFVPIVIYILTRNKTNKKVLLGIIISFIGIIIVLNPGSDIFQPVSVIAGGCFDWILWSVTPSYFTLIGTIVTILGGIFVIINRNQVNT